MKTLISAVILASASIALGACTTNNMDAMRTVTDSPVGNGADKEIIAKAIKTSLAARLWTIEDETEDTVTASILSDGGKMAKIKVTYAEDSFDIERLATKNLGYDEDSGLIAARYNRWITNIEHDVMIRTGVPRADADAHVYSARAEIETATAAAEQ